MSCIQHSMRLLAAATCGLLSAAATHSAQILPAPAVDAAAASAGSVEVRPVAPRARTTHRLVYTCVEPQLVTYADRPCGPTAARLDLRVTAPPVAAGEPPRIDMASTTSDDARRAAAAKADAMAARAAAERAATCARLEAAADEVDSLMRAGYPAREAGRMWERWRAARARLREARC